MPKIFEQKESKVCQLIEADCLWAEDMWEAAAFNNWLPSEVDMTTDIAQLRRGELTDDEMLVVRRTLGLFSAGESMVANSVLDVESRFITDAACRDYLARKNYEETLHNKTVKICCEAYGLDRDEVAKAYKNIPTIKAKERFLNESLDSFEGVAVDSPEGIKLFLKNMAVFYLVCEGTWFFSNFAIIMAMGSQNKLPGLFEQIQYTVRDEALHVEFGLNVIKQAQQDYPELWEEVKEEISQVVQQGVAIELEYVDDILPTGILGVTNGSMKNYIKYLAGARLESIDLEDPYNASHDFHFLDQCMEADCRAGFFERRNQNYQIEGSMEDDLEF